MNNQELICGFKSVRPFVDIFKQRVILWCIMSLVMLLQSVLSAIAIGKAGITCM